MALTIRDIARLSGTSRSTVSRVLNNHPRVSPEARERVLAVIREHDYQPHHAARALSNRRANTIGLVVPRDAAYVFNHTFYPPLIRGMAEVANRHDYFLTLALVTDGVRQEDLVRRVVQSGQMDGVVVASAAEDDLVVVALRRSRMPFVMLSNPPAEADDIVHLSTDLEAGVRQAMQHLLALGHRRIACLCGPLHLSPIRDIVRSYQAALADAGLAQDPALLVPGMHTEEHGLRGVLWLLRQRPTAILASDSTVAAGALQALAQAGVSVPHDVSIVSFGVPPAVTSVAGGLTMVPTDAEGVGRRAADKLIGMIERPSDPVGSEVLPLQLVVGGSTAAPRRE